MTTPSPSHERSPDSTGLGDLVSRAERDALERDALYALPQPRQRRTWTTWALVAALPALVAAALWNIRVMDARLAPPPSVEALDLARTLRVTASEVASFAALRGRLPTTQEASSFLPAGARFVEEGDGAWALVLPAPVVGELRYRSVENPDAWLRTLEDALAPGGGA